MDPQNISEKINLNVIRTDKFSGVEIDVVYNEKINDLVVYHGSKNSKGPHIDFQCFSGSYLRLEDFINLLGKEEKTYGIWIDLKNESFNNIRSAALLISKLPNTERFIVETQSYLGAYYLKSQGLKTSLWLKIRGPIEDSFGGKLRMFKNKMRMKAAGILGVDRISQSCGKMLEFSRLFSNDFQKMCWNTSGKVLIETELTKIQGLRVVLESP
jgi:hypothetical protein